MNFDSKETKSDLSLNNDANDLTQRHYKTANYCFESIF